MCNQVADRLNDKRIRLEDIMLRLLNKKKMRIVTYCKATFSRWSTAWENALLVRRLLSTTIVRWLWKYLLVWKTSYMVSCPVKTAHEDGLLDFGPVTLSRNVLLIFRFDAASDGDSSFVPSSDEIQAASSSRLNKD